MSKWKNFETSCVGYLSDKFGEYADFEQKGGSDSSVSDIEVISKNKGRFFIEAKCCPAQCGQFVLFPNEQTKSFDYSTDNLFPINDAAKEIIEYMNKNFDKFKSPEQRGR